MNYLAANLHCLRNYVTFNGRAARSEFWWFELTYILVSLALQSRGDGAGDVLTSGLYILALGLLLPSLAVGARRLHDIGKSGWWQLVLLIPIFGWLWLAYCWAQAGEDGRNEYGF